MNKQPFDYYIILDFESTCEDGKKISPQEIIEFPSVLVSGETFEIVDQFRSFVKPVHHPRISDFCTELTGITQEQVDSAPFFSEVYQNYLDWLRKHNLKTDTNENGASFSFVLCGDWDLKSMLPEQMKVADPAIDFIPHCFRKWVNIKFHFLTMSGMQKAPGMPGMLEFCGLELKGRHHSGIDDCHNITRLAKYIAEKEVPLAYTTDLPLSRYPAIEIKLTFQEQTVPVTLEKRKLGSLLGLAGMHFRKQLTGVKLKNGAVLNSDQDLCELKPGDELEF